MSETTQYIIFIVVFMVALITDFGLFTKNNSRMTEKRALLTTLFWVGIACTYGLYLWLHRGSEKSIIFFSGYIMEWSLSLDNVFVFIFIINSFKISEKYQPKILIFGVLAAMVLRLVFITIGIELLDNFHWILYIFGLFLLYTGYKMLQDNESQETDPTQTKLYLWLKKILPIDDTEANGKFFFKNEQQQTRVSILLVTVLMLAFIDIVFALDSIPAILGITNDNLIVYSSNIFAILGLRSLFFLLKSLSQRFTYMTYGIAIILIFIGLKIGLDYFVKQWVSSQTEILFSFIFIVVCLVGSLGFSIIKNKVEKK